MVFIRFNLHPNQSVRMLIQGKGRAIIAALHAVCVLVAVKSSNMLSRGLIVLAESCAWLKDLPSCLHLQANLSSLTQLDQPIRRKSSISHSVFSTRNPYLHQKF